MLHLSARPLTASKADGALFVNRAAELRRLARAVKLRLNTYVAGGPGTGRTSLLHRVEADLAERAWFVNLEDAARPEDVSERLADAASERGLAPPMTEGWPPLALLARATLKFDPVFLVDGLSDGLRAQLFGRYRDAVWEARAVWVVTGSTSRLDPPEDAFFTSTVELDMLDEEALEELLVRRAGGGRDADARLVRELASRLPEVTGPTTPRAALAAASAVLLADDPNVALDRLRRHAERAHELPDTAQLALDALLSLGATYAGDPRLLEELGVTRTRAVQVLHQLKSDGLVRAVRRGRRTLYELAWRAA